MIGEYGVEFVPVDVSKKNLENTGNNLDSSLQSFESLGGDKEALNKLCPNRRTNGSLLEVVGDGLITEEGAVVDTFEDFSREDHHCNAVNSQNTHEVIMDALSCDALSELFVDHHHHHRAQKQKL